MFKEGDDAYEQLGPSGLVPPPPPPPPPQLPPPPPPGPPIGDMRTKADGKTEANTVGKFALRPGDDVDLSSERGNTLAGTASEDKASKSREKMEKDRKLEELKAFTLDIKPYKEPTMLKICHIVTLLLLVLSFLLMALTVVQFVDIFVWLPLLLGETD